MSDAFERALKAFSEETARIIATTDQQVRAQLEHPAVAFLLAAHQQAEALARAASREAPGHCPPDPVEFVLGMCDISTPAIEAAERHIRLHDPASVLRRVATERKLLAEHQPTEGYDESGYRPGMVCGTCAEADRGGDLWGRLYPCRTVLLLAECWGWAANPAAQQPG